MMSDQDTATQDKVLDIFSEFFDLPRDQITLETTRDDVPEWDSFAHINLVLSIEGELGISLNAGDIASVENLSELCGLVAKTGSK